MGKTINTIVSQVTSGRWILTVICGFVFAFAVWKRIIPDAATASIITSVFVSYFGKTDRGKNGHTTGKLKEEKMDIPPLTSWIKIKSLESGANSIDTKKLCDVIETWGLKEFTTYIKRFCTIVGNKLIDIGTEMKKRGE
jgi:hypothetical protein